MLTLENISNRLLVVPKPARVSALRAELTSLNHKLPAEVCMPLWCTGYDSHPDSVSSRAKPHHRIVRVPPGESVVLNSAERAPYLLILEILHGDLDFEPDKRGNKELLKNIIKSELHSSKSQREHFNTLITPENKSRPTLSQSASADEALNPKDEDDFDPLSRNSGQSPMASTSEFGGEEEIDLVEQVYGGDLSVHQTPDLSDSFVTPVAPKNRALDIATWSRAGSSSPSSPAVTPAVSSSERLGKSAHIPVNSQSSQGSVGSSRAPVLSLDEYSQRMRTAAIMLAQLNASLIREATVIANPENPGPGPDPQNAMSSWFPMANWLVGVNTTNPSGPLHPSLAGTAKSQPAATAQGSVKYRLQQTEVAAIRDRIMQEMLALEEERMERMQVAPETDNMMSLDTGPGGVKTAEDEQIIRKELNREDPSAVVFSESWTAKKVNFK